MAKPCRAVCDYKVMPSHFISIEQMLMLMPPGSVVGSRHHLDRLNGASCTTNDVAAACLLDCRERVLCPRMYPRALCSDKHYI